LAGTCQWRESRFYRVFCLDLWGQSPRESLPIALKKMIISLEYNEMQPKIKAAKKTKKIVVNPLTLP
jgi:hypothetical protein